MHATRRTWERDTYVRRICHGPEKACRKTKSTQSTQTPTRAPLNITEPRIAWKIENSSWTKHFDRAVSEALDSVFIHHLIERVDRSVTLFGGAVQELDRFRTLLPLARTVISRETYPLCIETIASSLVGFLSYTNKRHSRDKPTFHLTQPRQNAAFSRAGRRVLREKTCKARTRP